MIGRRLLLGFVVSIGLALGVMPSIASGAVAVTVEWVPTSPFVAYVYGDHGTLAEPPFRIHNTTNQDVRVDTVLVLDPPEVLVPEDPAMGSCGGGWSVANQTSIVHCVVPVTAQQVTDGTTIKASIEFKAYNEHGTLLQRGTTAVLDIIGVPSPAVLAVTIAPVPTKVLVAPTDLTIDYDVANTGTVAFDDVSAKVDVQPRGAGPRGSRTLCPTDIGTLAVGQTHHGSCVVNLQPGDAGRFPLDIVVRSRGTAGELVPFAGDSVEVRLVVAGPHLEVDVSEIGLNEGQPAPGDTFTMSIQVFNVGSEALAVTTRTDPASPDCARDLGVIAPSHGPVFECAFQVPATATACRSMPYTMFADGVAADDQVVEATLNGSVLLIQPGNACGGGGGGGSGGGPAGGAGVEPPATDTAGVPLGPANDETLLIVAVMAGLIAASRTLRRRSNA